MVVQTCKISFWSTFYSEIHKNNKKYVFGREFLLVGVYRTLLIAYVTIKHRHTHTPQCHKRTSVVILLVGSPSLFFVLSWCSSSCNITKYMKHYLHAVSLLFIDSPALFWPTSQINFSSPYHPVLALIRPMEWPLYPWRSISWIENVVRG
jgi:hypothetical protein